MTRRQLLAWSGMAAAAPRATRAQARFPGTPYREYGRALPDFLRELAGRAYAARNREIGKLTTAGAIRARQKWVRETLWKLIGGMPERTPLDVRAAGGFARKNYRLEKLTYESVPGFIVPANLYIPTGGRPPFPGVLFQMGHARDGKAWESYQRCCQGLVQSGFLVLAFDPIGQGERINYPDSSGRRSRLPSPDDEHTMPGRQMLLQGDTVTRVQLWDAVRSLDVLAAHPLVDARRLASAGQSGGATLTMLLAAADDRLAAAAVASGNTENVACADFNPPGATDDAEQNFIASGPLGFDRWDLLYPMAPKPLWISVSDQDFLTTYSPEYIRNGWEEFQKLASVYRVLGAPGSIQFAGTPMPHGLAYDSRVRLYSFLNRWLKDDPTAVSAEPPTEPEKEEMLWVTPGGSVNRSLHSRTPFELNRDRPVTRRAVPLASLIGASRPAAGLRASVLSRVRWGEVTVEALEIAAAPHVFLPAWLYLPAARDRAKPLLLALESAGRDAHWAEGGIYHTLAMRGHAVCTADVRGVGDLRPQVGRGAAAYAIEHASEENYAWSSLILGAPLLGQRVTDMLALAAALRAHPLTAGMPVKLAASGRLAVPGLCAAVMDPEIAEIYLAAPLISYRSVVETENYTAPLSNFAFGMLESTDLPEMAASLAPRPITLAGTVDAAGEILPVSTVRAAYPGQHIAIEGSARWDADTLL